MTTAIAKSFGAVALLLLAPLAVAQTAPAKPVAAKPAAAAPAAAKAPAFKTPILKRAQIDALLAQPEKITVLDVRRPDELSRIGGFPVYLSVQVDDVEKNLAYIPKDRAVLTVSNHAGRAGRIGDLLTAKGYKVVGAAGVQTYEEEGGKLLKVVPPPPKKS